MSEKIRSIKCNVQCMNFLDGMFYALYFIAFNYLFLTTTMFHRQTLWAYHATLERAMNIVTFFLIGLAVVTIILLFDSLKERILPTLLLGAAIAYSIKRGGTYNNDILVFFLLTICSKKKSFKLIAYMSLFCGFSWLLAALIASRLGLIADVINFNGGHGFGVLCSTDLMCHLFTLTMLLFIIRKGRPGIPGIIMSAVFLTIDALWIQADIGFFCYAALFMVTIIYKFTAHKFTPSEHKLVVTPISFLMIISFIIMGTLTIVTTYFYKYDPDSLLNSVDTLRLIALRLKCGKTAFANFPLLPLGQKIHEFGEITDLRKALTSNEYFVLDISYIRILFHNGYIMLAAVITLFTALQIRLFRHRQYYAMFIITVFSVVCAIEHSMIEPAYCVFAYLMFSELDFDRPFFSTYLKD